MFASDDPDDDELVYKIGRTTGKRQGFVNAAESIQLRAVKVDQATGTRTYEITIARIVVPDRWKDLKNAENHDSWETIAFSWGGYSGSAIYNRHGIFIGLLFGGSVASGKSYFTPVEHLFEDIKRVTGAVKVELLGAP